MCRCVCVCERGEPCQDMFISSENDVCIRPYVPHMLFPAASGERTGPVYCRLRFIRVTVAHGPWGSVSVVRATE